MTDTTFASDESLYITGLEYDYGFDFVDADCKTIALLLQEQINKTFYNALRYNVIKTVRTFNDIYIPLTDYPVLKVYKVNESSGLNNQQISTTFKIVYALAFTQKIKVADISSFIGKEIRRVLTNASLNNILQVDWGDTGQNTISIDYEDFIAPDNTIYKYVTVTCPIFTFDG